MIDLESARIGTRGARGGAGARGGRHGNRAWPLPLLKSRNQTKKKTSRKYMKSSRRRSRRWRMVVASSTDVEEWVKATVSSSMKAAPIWTFDTFHLCRNIFSQRFLFISFMGFFFFVAFFFIFFLFSFNFVIPFHCVCVGLGYFFRWHFVAEVWTGQQVEMDIFSSVFWGFFSFVLLRLTCWEIKGEMPASGALSCD